MKGKGMTPDMVNTINDARYDDDGTITYTPTPPHPTHGFEILTHVRKEENNGHIKSNPIYDILSFKSGEMQLNKNRDLQTQKQLNLDDQNRYKNHVWYLIRN